MRTLHGEANGAMGLRKTSSMSSDGSSDDKPLTIEFFMENDRKLHQKRRELLLLAKEVARLEQSIAEQHQRTAELTAAMGQGGGSVDESSGALRRVVDACLVTVVIAMGVAFVLSLLEG